MAPEPSPRRLTPALHRRAYLLPLALIFAFIVVLFFALNRLLVIEHDMRENVSDNMLWVVTQAHAESLKLAESRARAALAEDTHLELRAQLLLGRLRQLDDGPQRRYLERIGFGAELSRIVELGTELADGMHLGRAEFIIDDIGSQLGQMANAVMIEEWNAAGEQLERHRRTLIHTIASIVVILVLGSVISLRLLQALNRSREDGRQTHHQLEAAIDTAPDGFALFNRQQDLSLANRRFFELVDPASRMASEEMTMASGLPLPWLLEHLYALAPEAKTPSVSASPPNQTPDQIRAPTRNPNNPPGLPPFSDDDFELRTTDEHWLHATVRTTRDGFVLVRLADISSYKHAERVLHDALEREKEISEFYRSFAAMASHQFRIPLAVVDSGLQRLARRKTAPGLSELRTRCERMRASIARMIESIEHATRAALADAGGRGVDRHAVALDHLVSRMAQAMRDAYVNSIEVRAPGEPPIEAICDPVLVEQILGNLFSNAVKYSPAEAPIVLELDADAERVLCTLHDHGIGIEDAEQARIFERFYRAPNARTHPGSGLGLNIARHLARIQGGDLTVRSTPGQGSAFTLSLPRAKQPTETA